MTKKLSKKLISIFLSLMMVLSLIPMGSMTVYAADCTACGGTGYSTNNCTDEIYNKTGYHNIDIDSYGFCLICSGTTKSVVCTTCGGTGSAPTTPDLPTTLNGLNVTWPEGTFMKNYNNTGVYCPVCPCVRQAYIYTTDNKLRDYTSGSRQLINISDLTAGTYKVCTGGCTLTLSAAPAKRELIPGSTTVYWSKSADGVVTISGEGEMPNLGYDNSYPWRDYPFDNSVTAVIIEEGVTHISDYAFTRCYSLTSVSIAASVTKIDNQAFNDCGKLSTVFIAAESELKIIGEDSFYACSSLTNISIPDGVERIEDFAFKKSGVKNIVIPASVTYLGYSSLDISGLISLTMEGTTPPELEGAFDGVESIYVPKKAVDTYKNVSSLEWYAEENRIKAIPHTHNLTYSVSGATLTAYCTESTGALSCDCQGKADDLSNAVSLTLTANNANYSGSAYTGASLGDTSAWTTAGLTVPTIKYVGRASTTYTESATAPTTVGTYTAKITAGDKTATKDFEITKANQTAPASNEGYTISYSNETLVANTNYEVSSTNGTNATALTDNKVTPGSTYYVRKQGNTNYNPSPWTTITLAARPTAPTGLGSVKPSATGVSDGKITGVSSAMEYKLSTATSWTAVTGTQVTGLAAGTYKVRTKATSSAFAGNEATVTIAEPHTHTFETTWSSNATQHWHAATCEHTSEKSSLDNHSGGTATCTAAAVCSTCGASYGSAKGHSFTNYVSDGNATCTTDGTKTATCDRTGCSVTDTVTDEGTATGHSFATEWSKDATHHWHAATCGHTTEKSGYAQHSYTSEVTTPATCTSAGVTTYTCTCGDTYTDTTDPAALGHSFTNYVPNYDATCTEDGTKTAVCDRNGCGVTDTITDEGTATGHSFTNYVSDKNATCTKDGTKTAACDNECGTTDTITDNGTATGHHYTSKVTKKATYSAAGVRTYTCSNGCGSSYKETIPRLKITAEVRYKNSTKLDAGFKVTSSTKDITVKWGKVADADGYMVYANYCGNSTKPILIKTIKGADTKTYSFTKLNGKKLDLNKNFKVYVVAYKTVDGKKVEFGKTITGHVVGGKNKKYTNPTKVTVKKDKVTLSVNKTSKISATVTYKYANKKHLSDGHAAEKRYRSSNKAVATVDANGKITAVGKGTCTVYVFAKNGTSAKVTVTVK